MAGSLLRMTIPPPIIAISNFILKVSTKVHMIRELSYVNEKFNEKNLQKTQLVVSSLRNTVNLFGSNHSSLKY